MRVLKVMTGKIKNIMKGESMQTKFNGNYIKRISYEVIG